MNKNKEMWNDWLIDNCVDGMSSFGVNMNTYVPFSCHGCYNAQSADCSLCKFLNMGNCHKARRKWLDEEYIEPCLFKTGDIVEVSDTGKYWYLRRFMKRIDDQNDTYFGWYRCFREGYTFDDDEHVPCIWKYCRIPEPYKEEEKNETD